MLELVSTLARNLIEALLRDGQGAIAIFGRRIHIEVHATLGIFVQTFRLRMLVVFHLEVPLHDFLLPARSIGKDPELLVHLLLLLEAVDRFCTHPLQHLVGEFDLASPELLQVLRCLRLI